MSFMLMQGGLVGRRTRTFFVAPAAQGGSDTNNGLSEAAPWASITKVNGGAYQPGDRILFMGGQTFSGNLDFTTANWNPALTATNPITIGSYGTGRATISSGAARGILTTNLAGFILQDLNFVGSGLTTDSSDGVFFWNGLTGSAKLNYIRATNLDISGYGMHGLLVFGGAGPASNGPDTAGFNDVVIDGVVSHGNCLSASTTLANAGIRVAGLYGFNADPTHPTHTNVTIRNCVSHTNVGRNGAPANAWTGAGIVVNGVRTALIERCVAHDCGQNSSSTGGPVGIMAFDADLVTIQYCEAYNIKTGVGNFDGGGFDLDGGMTNSVMQYNYSHDNEGHGFMFYNYTDAGKIASWNNNVCRYNISQNDNTNSSLNGGVNGSVTISNDGVIMTNAEFYNNTVYTNAATGVCLLVGHPTAGNTTGHVSNNIFYSSNGAYLVDTGTLNPTNLIFRGNDYFAAGTFRIRQNNTTYSTLAAWRLSPNREKLSTTDQGTTADPLLSSAGGGGTLGGYFPDNLGAYKLSSSSTMGEAGLNLQTTFSLNPGTLDFYGTTVPVGSSYGVGASETVAATSPGAMPAFSSAGAGVGSGGFVSSATIPATVAVGDVLILQSEVCSGSNDSTHSTPTGWTAFSGNPYGGAQRARMFLFWKKVAATTEGGTAVTFTASGTGTAGTTGGFARIYRFTAANGFAATPVANISAPTVNAGSTSVTLPTVNPGGLANRLAVCMLATGGTGGTTAPTVASATGETGGDWTEAIAEFSTTAGNDATLQVQTSAQTTGAQISGGTCTLSVSHSWVAVGFCLVPADI